MGLFGPSKNDGGLDMRFSSNKGGVAGKVLGGIGMLLVGAFTLAKLPFKLAKSTTSNSGSSQRIESNSFSDDADSYDNEEVNYDDENKKNMEQQVDEIQSVNFDNDNVDNITNGLDKLFAMALLLKQNPQPGKSVSAVKSKIKSGILKLKRLKEYETAKHYEKELNSLSMSQVFSTIMQIVLLIACLGGLLLIARGL